MTRWFRSHASKLDNPKVQRLSDALYRAWDSLLCIACRYGGVLPSVADAAFLLRKSEDATKKLIDALVAAELFAVTERGIEPHQWNEWQYKSDVSTDRVKQFRERQRNVSVTPSETESDTEAKTEQKDKKPAQARKKTRLSEDWQASEDQLAYAEKQGCVDPKDTAERFRLYHLKEASLHANWDSAWQYWCRNEKNFARTQATTQRSNGHSPAPTLTEDASQWAARLRGYAAGGFWSGNWGPRPEDGGSHIPPTVLAAWRASA